MRPSGKLPNGNSGSNTMKVGVPGRAPRMAHSKHTLDSRLQQDANPALVALWEP